jgi:transcriptional regulator with XRE-family HTH domain
MGAMKKSVHTPEYALLKSILREARQKAGLSQRELAARLDVPHSWVAKVESGERRIDLVEFGWFMTACGVSAAETVARLSRQFLRRDRQSRVARRPSK